MSRVLPGLVSVLLLLGLLQPGWLQPLPGRSLSAPTPAAAPAVALTTSPQPLAGASLLPPAASPAEPVHVAQFAFNEHVVVHTAPSAERAREFLALAAQRRQGRGALALVGLREIPLPARRTTWRGHGIDLLRYVPDRGWIARLDADQIVDPAATLAWAAQEVTALSAFDPDLRIDPRLRAAAGPDDVPLYVHAAADADLEQTRRDLLQQGFPLGPGPGYLAGRLDPALLAPALAALGRHPDVQFVERGSGAHLLNTPSAKILQSGSYTGALPIYAQGVYGSNQIIAVLDTGIDADSCYFRDAGTGRPPTNFPGGTTVDLTRRKVIACDFWKPGDNPGNVAHWDDLFHGTRVAGHAAGSDLSFPVGTNQHNGMAPGAWLVVQDAGYLVDACGDIPGMGCPVTNFLPALQQAYAQGARIHNNSWGDNENAGMGTQNLYSAVSAELDAMAWSNRDFLIVCAAGNSSLTNIVGSPSTAKNGLSVAAGQAGANAHLIAGFSSRGWTRDGRIKPDLTAPGQSVTSANNDGNITTFNCTTSTGDGTSYASPMVCGLAALVRDYFARGYYPGGVPAPADARTNISAALVKAVLLNGCVDMSGAVARPPARDQGWGRPNLSRVLAFTNAGFRLHAEDHGPVFTETPALPVVRGFHVTGTGQPVRVTLVWTDFPGTPGAGKQLVNDLDLLVRTPGGVYRGNALSNGVSHTGLAFDRSNNVEQVVLPAAFTGLVEVSVWAHVIPQATQDFALVVTGVLTNQTDDADGDGMPEYWEQWHFAAGPPADASSDHDGDGVTDAAEYVAGTDPTNALSVLRWAGLAGDAAGIQLTAPLAPGRRFDLYHAPAAQPDLFVPLADPGEGIGLHITGIPETNQVFTFTDVSLATNSGPGAESARIYQLRASAP